MKIKFAAQRAQFAAAAAVQDRLGDAEGSAKSGDDAAYRGHLYLRSGVAHQIDRSTAQFSPHRNPALVDWNPRALELDRLEFPFFEELFQAALCLRACFSDHAER